MTRADAEAVLAFWRGHDGVGLGDSDTPGEIAAYLDRNPKMSLVARENGRIIAAVLCGHDGRRGCLYHLAVASSHRRQGLGRRLVERCIESLRLAGIPKCNVYVYGDNLGGREFWKETGFAWRSDLIMMQRRV